MKSEHRHDLQTNELGKMADKLTPFFATYGNQLMIGACIVMLAASGLVYWMRGASAKDAAAWRELATARNAEQYQEVWYSHRGTVAATWARLHEGESRLSTGVQSLFTNVEAGREELNKAREAFQWVIGEKNVPADIRARSMFGLARTLESLSEGTDSDAVAAYEQLVREYPDSIYRKDADTRIAALKSGSGQEFYAWFAKYPRPKPSERRPRDKAKTDLDDEDADFLEQLDLNGLTPKKKPAKKSEVEEDSTEGPEMTDPSQTEPAAEGDETEEDKTTEPSADKPAENPEDKADEKPAEPAESDDTPKGEKKTSDTPAEPKPESDSP